MADQQPRLDDPAFVCTYGPSGVGKSVDALYSFPCGLYVAAPGALKPAATVVGYAPRQTKAEAQHIMEVTEMIRGSGDRLRNFDAIIIDDLSLLAERTLSVLERRFAHSKNRFAVWDAMRDVMLEFRDAARRARIHVLVNAHDQPPQTKPDGTFVRGGPRLPGRMPGDFPTATDVCLHMIPHENGRLGWPAAYRCNVLYSDWSTKDRHGCTPDYSPPNVGEILRLAGYALRRTAGLEWQERAVAATAEALLQAPATKEAQTPILQGAADTIRAKYTKGFTTEREDMAIRWVLRDAVDRTALKRARRSMLAPFGVV